MHLSVGSLLKDYCSAAPEAPDKQRQYDSGHLLLHRGSLTGALWGPLWAYHLGTRGLG